MKENPSHKRLTENDEITLKELILKIQEWCKFLMSKWLTILIFGLIGAVFGFAYAYFKKPVYTATTSFVLQDDKGGGAGLGSLAGLASMAGVNIDGGGGLFQGDNILELYKSRTMIEKTLLSEIDINGKKQLLIENYIKFKALREQWETKPALKNIKFDEPTAGYSRVRDSILNDIAEDITKNYLVVQKLDKQSSIIKVSIRCGDESFAKAFNDLIVKNVNDFYFQTVTKKSAQNVDILQHKTDSVRSVMNGAIYAAAAVSDATPNLNPTRQIQRAAPMQRSQFNAETNKAILGEMVKNLELAKISYMKDAPLIQVIDQPVYPLRKEQLGKKKGILLGGILGGFISVVILLIKRFFKTILSE
ncbi:putative nucleotidyltransferase [Pedobacter africanus]|uniref:Nucleotidyltransferase n=1 Tax=Pedobacter africanus TaxID=151894 RepID=A0ACC6L430_9SPHI|nr:Wzz/FepE/Etk N-terminal domain-containing protein [Pedobacter africanus]MDR6786127.1 putative nucleotidyltransferase [Pedobacter africanus]